MRLSRTAFTLFAAAAFAVGVPSAALLAADEAKPAAAEEKSAAGKPKKAKAARLTKPWKDMTSLTDEQKTQIAEIHRKAVEEIKQVEQREEAAIMAILNDAQRTEVEGLKAKSTTDRKMKKPAAGAEPAAATPSTAEKAG